MNHQFLKKISLALLLGIILIYLSAFLFPLVSKANDTTTSSKPTENKKDMDEFTKKHNITPGTAPNNIPPSPVPVTNIIPYKFETGIPLIPGAEKGKQLEAMTLPQLVGKVIKAAMLVSGIVAFVIILWAGYEYLTAAGDPKKQKSALLRIAGAIIGLLLLFAFWIILNTINPDILKDISITRGGGEGGSEVGGNGTVPDDVNSLLKKENIIWYPGAKKDLEDMANGIPIDPAKNDPNYDTGVGNCDTLEEFISNSKCADPNCLWKVLKDGKSFASSVDQGILQVVDYITNLPIANTNFCSNKYNVGPFISNHNNCGAIAHTHPQGKAVDITLGTGNPNTEMQCTQGLLEKLGCKTTCDLTLCCNKTIGGVDVCIRDETCNKDADGNLVPTDEPHIHIEIRENP